MIPLRVTIDDSRGLAKIAVLLEKASDYRPVMEGPVRQLVRRAIIDQFRTRGGYGGSVWKALAPRTIADKTRAGVVGKGPLKFTEDMYHSFTKIGHPARRETITKMGYSLRSLHKNERGEPFPAVHQDGGGRVPQRQIVPDPMPPSFMRELRKIVKGYLIEVQFGPGRSRVR